MIPKFRAWLPRQKEMVDVREITFVEGKVRCVYYKTGTEDHNSDILSSTCYEGMTFKLMQATGLEDFDGKEIYEGDIVFWQWGEIGDYTYTNSGEKIVDSDPRTLILLEEADCLLVLGNIYENPELVKEVKE